MLKGLRKGGAKYSFISSQIEYVTGETYDTEQLRNAYRYMVSKRKALPETVKEDTHPLAEFTHGSVGTKEKRDLSSGRFFVTSIAPTNPHSPGRRNVHRQALAAVDAYCERQDAELVLLPMRAHMPSLKGQPDHYDSVLQHWSDSIRTEFSFNKNLRAVDLHLNPQTVNPLTRLWEIPGSSIVAHPKQDLELVATGNDGSPRMLCATGALTYPQYLDNRTGRLARERHVMGGLIVEIDHGIFHVRQVQFAEDGSFVDLGVRYLADGSQEDVRAAGIKLGDIHVDELCHEKWQAALEIMDLVRPEVAVTGDFITHSTISGHEEFRHLTRYLKASGSGLWGSLAAEYSEARKFLEELFLLYPNVEFYFDASNHHDWIDRYLDKGRYLKDTVNYGICHEMVAKRLEGYQGAPFVPYVDPMGRANWLSREDELYIDGMQFACHGDMGPNGKWASPNNLQATHGEVVHGHTHTSRIRGNVWAAGHLSEDRHGYNKGPSSWMGSVVIRYHGGHTQLVNIIEGRYRL